MLAAADGLLRLVTVIRPFALAIPPFAPVFLPKWLVEVREVVRNGCPCRPLTQPAILFAWYDFAVLFQYVPVALSNPNLCLF